ncbi:MAG: bifunctional DNA-formamidopyrimidine glycosylase/DNA-(apurinic or apyrimidinic site) lyase [Burkholderiaceae bacterium]
MPELPEVEVTRQGFADRIEGAEISAVRVGKPLRWPLGVEADQLVGRRVGKVSRRGKYLWLALAYGGFDDGGLLMHLGMSGSLAFAHEPPAPGAHDHFDLVTTHGTLRLTDPRRFGAVVWSDGTGSGRAGQLLAGLGIEPFDPRFDGTYLHAALQGRRVAVKTALLAGDIVVGAGNIYACEALFEAAIDPRVRADRLSRPRSRRLADALRETLARAVEAGGSTLRNFRDSHGRSGAFQLEARVYGRAGMVCVRCGGTVRRIVQGQRATFFCPGCQSR